MGGHARSLVRTGRGGGRRAGCGGPGRMAAVRVGK
ncbi:hypothetical protein SFR_1864 [Streptomyces sp. FR-008]|nr:hypothetical protein SFR_1864 [Streptomyces sp. FR-008]